MGLLGMGCLPSCRALLRWMLLCAASLVELRRGGRLVGWALMLPAGNEALQGAAPCDCDSDIRIRNEDTCEVWTLLDW
jgi:hypothetical protein